MAKKRKTSKKTAKTTTKSESTDYKKSVAVKKRSSDRKREQVEGIIKTLYPAFLGVIFGFISYYAFGTGISEEGTTGLGYPWYFIIIVIGGATYYFQKYTYPLLKIKSEDFATKDWLYVEFIAIDLWLVTWTILLN